MAYGAEGVAATDAAEGHEQAAEWRRLGHQSRQRQQRHAILPLRRRLGEKQAGGRNGKQHEVANGGDDRKATEDELTPWAEALHQQRGAQHRAERPQRRTTLRHSIEIAERAAGRSVTAEGGVEGEREPLGVQPHRGPERAAAEPDGRAAGEHQHAARADAALQQQDRRGVCAAGHPRSSARARPGMRVCCTDRRCS